MLSTTTALHAVAPHDAWPTVGMIGMGAMGKMYTEHFSNAGCLRINVCDVPENYPSLKKKYDGSRITVMKDGHDVSRSSDFIIYSVEAESIGKVVKEYGPSTKYNAIVAGQTSVKTPEIEAFEAYLPKNVHILSIHSLHGPTVNPAGQPLILIQHRASDEALIFVESILSVLKSRFVYLSYKEHDRVTANTQAVTHAAFLSMGTVWRCRSSYPWLQGNYIGGIENAKVNITLRIYSNAWHVYAGLAILNPSARVQIDQYARSAAELYDLMKGGKDSEAELTSRLLQAKAVVFGNGEFRGKDGKRRRRRKPILLSQELLDRFSICDPDFICSSDSDTGDALRSTRPPKRQYRPNSHLSLLAMVDCWAKLEINPYEHLELAATPIFRLFLGVAEHLFLAPASLSSYAPRRRHRAGPQTMLTVAIDSALYDKWHRDDDREFVRAARGWADCVASGSFELYKAKFEDTRAFFEKMFDEAREKGSEMIRMIMETELANESSSEE